MAKKVVAMLAALLLLVSMAGYPVGLVGPASASHGGGTIIVDANNAPGTTNTTIQGAVNHADPGDEIYVRAGTYNEAVVVNKSVTIFTNRSVVMDGRGLNGPAFNITNTTSGSSLDDVVITGFPAIENYSTGIAVSNAGGVSNVILENNTVQNVSDTGILLSYSAGTYDNVTLANNTVTSPQSFNAGIAFTTAGTATGNDTVLLRNELNESNADAGILIRTQGTTASLENTTILENNASLTSVGLHLDLRDTSTISDLNVSRNGFAKVTDAGVRIEGNAAGTAADLTDVILFENALNNSAGGTGLNVSASETLNVNNLSLLRNAINNNGRAIDVNISGASTWESVVVAGNALNDSTASTAAIGLRLRTHQQASVTDLNLTGNVIGNGDKGLYVVERGTSSLDNLTVDSNSFQGNAEHGAVIWTQGAATATDIEFTSNALNGTTGAAGLTVPSAGVTLLSSVDATITDVSLSENNMSDNPIGLQVGAAHRSEVSGVNLSSNLVSRSSTQGVFLLAGLATGGAPNDGTIADVTIDSNSLNGSSNGIGVHVESWGTSNVSNVQVTGNNASDNAVGVLARPGNSSTIEGLNVSSNLLVDSGQSAVALGAGTTPASTATLRNVTVEANALNETVVGLNVEGQGSATVTEIDVTENDLRNNDVGLQVKPSGGSTVSALNATNNLLNGSTAGTFSSVVIAPLDSATVDDVHLFQNALNDNAATGLPAVVVNATGSATASNLLVEENALDNNDVGVYLTADETGTVTGVNVTTNLLNDSTNGALVIEASGSGTVSAVDVSTNGLNDTAANGLDIRTADDATVGPLNVTENSFANTTVGVHADVGGNSTLTGLNVTNNLLNQSSLHGIKLVADGSVARITDVHVLENLLNDTATEPLLVGATGEANVSGVLVQTNDLSNNTVGAHFYAHNDSTIHGLNVTNNDIEGSSHVGVYLQVRSDAGATSTVQGVDLLGNALNETEQGPGLQIDAFDASAVADVRVETNDLRHNLFGLLVNAPEDATVTGLTVTEALASGSDQGALRLVAGTHGTNNAATISGVDVRDAGLNDSVNGAGLEVQAFGSSRVADLSLDTADVSNNTVGLVLNATGSATIENVSAETALFSENDVAAALAQAGQSNTGSAATVTNVSVTETGLNDTVSGPGFLVVSYDDSTVTDLRFDTVSFENNTRGLFVLASNGSTVDGIDVSSALFADNDDNGALLQTGAAGAGSSSTIANVSFESVGLNETAGTGLAVMATGTSTVTGLDIDTASLADNTDWGLTLQAIESGTVRDVSAETALFSGNANGAAAVAGSPGGSDTATITNVSFTEVGLNETAGTGLLLGAQADSTVTDVSVETSELSDNEIGLYAAVRDGGTLTNLSVNEALVNGSTEHGVLLNATGTASLSEVEFDTMGVNFTATGAGLEVRSADSATVSNVTVFQVLTKENHVGQRYVAHDGSTITGLNVTNTLNENNDRSGLAIEAGAPSGTHSATISDVDIRVNAFNDTASGAGVNVSAWDGATVTGVTLFQNAIDANRHGLRVAARDGGTLDDVNVTQALIQDSTANGLLVDGDSTGNYAAVKVRLSLIQNSAVAGVNVSPNAAVSGISVHRAFISGNAIGVDNNADATFDARFNWWGDSSGPGSVADADAPFRDPDTGKLANGDGDTVSENPSFAGVSNVRFDPGIGGKTRAADDPELIDPVAQLTDQNFSITVAGQTIEGPVSDFVGLTVWEAAGLPFRADDAAAATKVQNTRIDLRTSQGDVRIAGEGSNRKFIKVFNQGEQLTLDYVKVSPGADTSRFAGDDVKLVAVKLNSSANVSSNLEDMFTTDLDSETGEATLATNATKVEVFDIGSLDGNGELRDIPYTPGEPGSYVLFVTRVDSGDGLQVTNSGNLTFNVLNDSTTFLGAEVITVQETSSTAAPRANTARPGDTVVFDADSNLNSNNVTHAVVIYDKKAFEEGLTVINASNTTVQINGSIITATITGSNAGQPFLVSINASTDGTVNNVSTDGALGNTTGAIGITRFGASSDTVAVQVPTNVVFGSQQNKTFNWVHLAVAEENTTKRSTTDAKGDVVHVTITDAPSIQVSPTSLNFDGVQIGSSKTRDVDVSNTGNATLNITSTAIVGADPGPFTIVSGGGADQLAPGANKTISVRFSPTAPGPKNANLRIRSNDSTNPTVDVSLSGSGPSGAGGGGGQAGTATPTDTPTPTPTPTTATPTTPSPTTTAPPTTAPPTTTTAPTTTAPPPTPAQPFPFGIAIGIAVVLAILGGLAYVFREAIMAAVRGE